MNSLFSHLRRLSFFATLFLSQFANAQYSKEQILEDFNVLKENLRGSANDLYADTPEEVFDAAEKQLVEKLKGDGDMSKLDVFRLLQPYVALAKQSHCSISLPFDLYGAFVSGGGKVFPIEVIIENDQLIVSHIYKENPSNISKGAVIESINHQSAEVIIYRFESFFSGDTPGFIHSFTQLLAFPRCYWFVFGEVSSFEITLDGGHTITLEAIPAAEFESIKSTLPSPQNTSRGRQMYGDVGYYRPGIFLNKETQQDLSSHELYEKGEFMEFFEETKEWFRSNHCNSVIIDVRGNPGGDNSFSDPIIAWVADRSFKFCSRFEVRTSEITKAFWETVEDPNLQELRQDILDHENGERFESDINVVQPAGGEERFKGDVYLLIDRFSYSNAVSIAAVFKDYGFGTIIGESTTDTPSAFGAAQSFTLPNTGFSVMFPKAFITRPNGDTTIQGVKPDHEVKEDLFTTNDEVLEYTLSLIAQN